MEDIMTKEFSKDKPKANNKDKFKGKDKKKDIKNPKNKNINRNVSSATSFSSNNVEKKSKTFMYQNLAKSKSFNSNYSRSNFDYVCFRGAHLKSCDFYGCTFNSTEFIGTNLKDSKFTNAKFENAVFEGARLVDVDFKGAEFINTIFVACDMDTVKNLNLRDENIRVFKEMPEFEISEELKTTLETVMENKFVKKSRVLDTREGKINYISLMILQDNFDEETLIKGLNKIEEHTDRDFYTLSFIIKLIKKLEKDGTI